MKAQALIANACLGPDEIKVLTQAFDEAWRQIEQQVEDRPVAKEAARYRLANLVLGMATTASKLDAGRIRDEAVQLMQANLARLRP